MRVHKSAIFLGLILITLIPAGRAAFADKGIPAWKREIQAKLQRRITVEFDDFPLRDVLNHLRESLDVDVQFDYARARDVMDEPITLHLRNKPASTILRTALRQVGLTHTLANGAVFVSTHAGVLSVQPTVVRTYYVGDVLHEIAVAQGGRDRGDGEDDDDAGNGDGRGGDAAGEALLRLIVLFTGPENWDHVEVIGRSGDKGDESESREDGF